MPDKIMFQLTNVIPERIIFVSQGITVLVFCILPFTIDSCVLMLYVLRIVAL